MPAHFLFNHDIFRETNSRFRDFLHNGTVFCLLMRYMFTYSMSVMSCPSLRTMYCPMSNDFQYRLNNWACKDGYVILCVLSMLKRAMKVPLGLISVLWLMCNFRQSDGIGKYVDDICLCTLPLKSRPLYIVYIWKERFFYFLSTSIYIFFLLILLRLN